MNKMFEFENKKFDLNCILSAKDIDDNKRMATVFLVTAILVLLPSITIFLHTTFIFLEEFNSLIFSYLVSIVGLCAITYHMIYLLIRFRLSFENISSIEDSNQLVKLSVNYPELETYRFNVALKRKLVRGDLKLMHDFAKIKVIDTENSSEKNNLKDVVS